MDGETGRIKRTREEYDQETADDVQKQISAIPVDSNGNQAKYCLVMGDGLKIPLRRPISDVPNDHGEFVSGSIAVFDFDDALHLDLVQNKEMRRIKDKYIPKHLQEDDMMKQTTKDSVSAVQEFTKEELEAPPQLGADRPIPKPETYLDPPTIEVAPSSSKSVLYSS